MYLPTALRRSVMLASALWALACGAVDAVAQGPASAIDAEVQSLMQKYQIPGASIAVARDGQLIFAKAYGFADRDAKVPVTAATRFRVASLTKPITAAVVLQLAGEGKLALDAPIASLLDPTAIVAPNTRNVTVRNLLQHAGQWGPRGSEMNQDDLARLLRRVGAARYGDVPFAKLAVAALADAPHGEPGKTVTYSNFGYCVLGVIIEKVTGLSYDEAARRMILNPAGASSFGLAASYRAGRLPNEARTYDFAGAPTWRLVIDGKSIDVSRPDAYWPDISRQTCSSGGRWVATPRDYLRVLASIGGRRAPVVGRADSMALLFDRKAAIPTTRPNEWVTHGLFYDEGGGVSYWSHTGGYAGTATVYGRTSTGFDWVLFYNSRPEKDDVYRDTYRALWPIVKSLVSTPAIGPL